MSNPEIRLKSGHFRKGKSGNPGGRPKEIHEVKELARQHTVEAVERLAFWMRSDNAKASVSAASVLLDRGHGKATQFIEQETTVRYVARVPDKANTAATWQQQHSPDAKTLQ